MYCRRLAFVPSGRSANGEQMPGYILPPIAGGRLFNILAFVAA
jgi:hypothetical protein